MKFSPVGSEGTVARHLPAIRSMSELLSIFEELFFLDFEFGGEDGDLPIIRSLVALVLPSGKLIRLRRHQMGAAPPYRTDKRVLGVMFMASAEMGCHREMGWPMFERILDLHAEHRNSQNGIRLPVKLKGSKSRWGILEVSAHYGLDVIAVAEKEEMRALAMRGPQTEEEWVALVNYNQEDVDLMGLLLPKMLAAGAVDIWRAVGARGRYVGPARSAIERVGTPIDMEVCPLLREHWQTILKQQVERVDAEFGIFGGGVIPKQKLFNAWLVKHDIPWLRTESGLLATDKDTFREMAKVFPIIRPVSELLQMLAEMRLFDLTVGSDGRNRTPLWSFASKSGRTQPNSGEYIFGPSVWVRGLIKPPPGYVVIYIDYCQQEYAILAYRSGDPKMIEAYESGDPFLKFGEQIGATPEEAIENRDMYKTCIHGINYDMSEYSLAARISAVGGSRSIGYARDFKRQYWNTYHVADRWLDNEICEVSRLRYMQTVFGWTYHIDPDPRGFVPKQVRSFRNFPMQGNGAEMLRWACIYLTEAGIEVCATVHDAVLIQAPIDKFEDVVAEARQHMDRASRLILNGPRVRTDAAAFLSSGDKWVWKGASDMPKKIAAKDLVWPGRYMDKRGGRILHTDKVETMPMWDRMMILLRELTGNPDIGAFR
jgi:DNA polymerase I